MRLLHTLECVWTAASCYRYYVHKCIQYIALCHVASVFELNQPGWLSAHRLEENINKSHPLGFISMLLVFFQSRRT